MCEDPFHSYAEFWIQFSNLSTQLLIFKKLLNFLGKRALVRMAHPMVSPLLSPALCIYIFVNLFVCLFLDTLLHDVIGDFDS